MRRWLLMIVVIAGVAIVGRLAWAGFTKQRATASQVTRAAYAEFGHGRKITCVAQDGNGAAWNCRSLRWGDDPACRQATVSWAGHIVFNRRTVFCEGL
jgi:hypothetical protein